MKTITIIPGTGNIDHVVEGIDTGDDITIVNTPDGTYTVWDGIIIKNK